MIGHRRDAALLDARDDKDRQAIAAALGEFQLRRVETRNRVSLAHILEAGNPTPLRLSSMDAASLVQRLLTKYLHSSDARLMDEYLRGSAPIPSRGAREEIDAYLFDSMSNDSMPLRLEVAEAENRCLNRLLCRFYAECCDADAKVDWARLAVYLDGGR